jgi:hypothetical protein
MHKGDHYYLIHPSVLVHPSRWAEVNPLDAELTLDERYNAAARLTLLHFHRVWLYDSLNLWDKDRPPRVAESLNPLPFAQELVRPEEDEHESAVEKAFGTKARRPDVQLFRGNRNIPNRSALAGDVSGPMYADYSEDEPSRTRRLFSREVGRRNFKTVSMAPQSA